MDSGNGLARETWGYLSSKPKNITCDITQWFGFLQKNGDGTNNGSPSYSCFPQWGNEMFNVKIL